jgi:hypothetical protein
VKIKLQPNSDKVIDLSALAQKQERLIEIARKAHAQQHIQMRLDEGNLWGNFRNGSQKTCIAHLQKFERIISNRRCNSPPYLLEKLQAYLLENPTYEKTVFDWINEFLRPEMRRMQVSIRNFEKAKDYQFALLQDSSNVEALNNCALFAQKYDALQDNYEYLTKRCAKSFRDYLLSLENYVENEEENKENSPAPN